MLFCFRFLVVNLLFFCPFLVRFRPVQHDVGTQFDVLRDYHASSSGNAFYGVFHKIFN